MFMEITKINKKIIFLSVQPDNQYFNWQVEVLINNAIQKGINPNWIEILFVYKDCPSNDSLDLASRYPLVRFFFYKEKNEDNFGYIPILRPDALIQHFDRFPSLSKEIIFYHDSDIIFKELPDFNLLINDDVWYLSDTVSYIGADYIKSKSDSLLTEMCEIAGISRELVEKNNMNSGGAQYLMKNIDSSYWKDVKKVTLDLYKFMLKREMDERNSMGENIPVDYNPIQKWCADMWGVLWCALKRGNEISISSELGFSWGCSEGMDEWNRYKIMHNAGVVDSRDGTIFYKGDYINKSPWDENFEKMNKNHNSYNYVEAILYAKKMREIYIIPQHI